MNNVNPPILFPVTVAEAMNRAESTAPYDADLGRPGRYWDGYMQAYRDLGLIKEGA